MDVYKLSIEHTSSKMINKDSFEEETRCREPWYQEVSGKTRSQFAVCPACDNPIQLIGLYNLPSNVQSPFGKHTTSDIKGIAYSNSEARDNCPYFKPRKHKKTDRKKKFDGTPRKILQLLIEKFDLVVHIIEKETGIEFSSNSLKGMLERYKGEQGYMYTGATLRNIPWIFAYMSDATDLFGQKVGGNTTLSHAIMKLAPEACVGDNGRVTSNDRPGEKKLFVDIKLSFIQHRFKKDSENARLIETMELVVSRQKNSKIVDIYKKEIQFDYYLFERLIQNPDYHMIRRHDRVLLAKEVLATLLDA
ncbi:hypothetical protein K4H28_01630 [Deefgea tanakiae]|uniref:Uncharacterized protein n=1 Tax=Deefgea tanakiae TaxID=2865840 RepID=A0ABX8ZAK3_9NEIS|nr:hypothetical protein [Deefgea tanakiae]QZA78158.1 hypothetical protein K4H28_01630 [Deefgea tanakiae]